MQCVSKIIPTDGTVSDLLIPGGSPAGALLFIALNGAGPFAGTVTVDYRAPGSAANVPLVKATNAPVGAVGLVNVRMDGPIGQARISFAGVTGAAQATVWLVPQDHPAGLFTGLAAITTQPYTEANVKNGVQFYGRAVWDTADSIVAGTTRKLWFKTGAKPVIVKLRDLQYVCEELVIRLFRAPTGVTGGTDLVIHNYNGINPVASTVVAKKNVTTTTDGVEFDSGDSETLFGAQTTAQRSAASIPQGRERILPANTEFLVTFTNAGTGAARVQYFLDWYEGGTDLPL